MKRMHLFLAVLVFFVAAMILSLPQITKANDWIITPDPMSISTSITFCMGSTAPSGTGLPAGYTAEIEFAAGFDLSAVTISDTSGDSEVELYLDATDCTGTPRITEATPTGANDRDAASISGQKLLFTLEDALTASQLFSFKIVAKAGNSVVTPGSAGNYILIARVYDGSNNLVLVDADFMYVGSANRVNISANVDPSITMTLSGTSCALGVFSAANIQTCNYNVTFNTNAATGYTAYMRDDGNLRNSTNDIDDTAGGTIAVGTEEYGVSTSKASQTITQINDADSDMNYDADDCTTMDAGTIDANASALSTTDQAFSNATGPISSDVAYLCHAASITGATPAGAYTHTVTITAVGNF